MYCQVCGAPNRDDHEFCVRCHQKLLVLSGPMREDEDSYEETAEESFSFDEHLLERISILEEAVKRTAGALRNTAAVSRQAYIHPEVLQAYVDGRLEAVDLDDLPSAERAVLGLLRERLDVDAGRGRARSQGRR